MSAHVEVEMLSAFLDDEMPAADRGRVEAHVAACVTCRTRLEDLRGVVRGLAALDHPAVPRTLDLVVPVRARRDPKRLARWNLRPVSGALTLPFAVVAALATLFLVVHAARVDPPAAAGHADAERAEADLSGDALPSGSVLRYQAGAWRPAGLVLPERSSRGATAAEWQRLREREPALARFAERHALELPWGDSWVRFAPGEAPTGPPPRDQAGR